MELVDQGLIFDARSARPGHRVCFFITLLRLSSGRVLAGFRRGSGKQSPDGNCCLAESTDNGASWQVICESFQNELEGTKGEIRSIALAEMGNDILFVFLTWADRSGLLPES